MSAIDLRLSAIGRVTLPIGCQCGTVGYRGQGPQLRAGSTRSTLPVYGLGAAIVSRMHNYSVLVWCPASAKVENPLGSEACRHAYLDWPLSGIEFRQLIL